MSRALAGIQADRRATARPLGPRVRRAGRAVVVYAALLVLTAFILLPVGWMVTAALKPDTAIVFDFPPQFFPTRYFEWDTFARTLFDEDEPYARYILNTAGLILVNMVFAVVANSLIAYAFARLRFRGRDRLFAVVIATMLLPAPVLLIPQFLLFFQIGWYNTYLPLTVPTLAGNAFFIFLLRQYMRTIPRELDEAARIDGASHWTIYRRIVLPLSAPVLTVVAVFTFLGVWNDFFGPLLYLGDADLYTVPVALASQVSRVGTEWNRLMAANLMAIVPPLVVYFVAQKQLIGGIASVGLKG
ncbi:MAG: carbohydrate ABC transporter permease [Chloroflexi bacterium]|nr:carbohydrate ABC transporter permease [Chloroflexota bacterium]